MSRARDNADLGDSYGVLGAGVTGGSGLTALASNPTVTLGSNATFPTGHVVKVVSRTGGQDNLTSDASWHDTNLYAEITLSNVNNEVLIMVMHPGLFVTGSGAIKLRLNSLIGSTTTNLSQFEGEGAYTGDASGAIVGASGINYVDTPNPATTSTNIKYFTDYNVTSGVTASLQRSSGTGSIVLMEIVK